MKKRLKNNEQPNIHGFNISNNKEDMYQQDISEQDSPFAHRNKQLCG